MTASVTPLLVWTITPPEPTSPLQGSYTLGYEFQTATTQKINHLGLYLPSTSSGFSSSHTITLWNSSQSVLATATVPAGPCVSIDYFCWFPLDGSPGLEVSLPPGTYRVGAFYDTNPSGFTNDPFVAQISPSGIVINPNPTVSGNFVRGYAGVGNVYPNLGANTSIRSYFGPNVGFLSATPYSGPTGQLWPLGVPDPLPVKSDPLMVWTNTPPSPSKLPFSATVGFEFQLGATRRVEELGIYATPVGFTSEHKLTLWNSSQTPLATATVSSGVHTTTDYFHWVPIDGPPGSYVTLPPGTYRVGAFYDVDNTGFSNDAFIEQVSISSIGVNPTVSANYIIGYSGPGDTYPSFAGDPSFRSFFGPNVRFKPKPTGQLWPIGSIFPEE